jgi:cyclopropane-fatty-acyl-phospholipid synthase
MILLDRLFRIVIKKGVLTVIGADGQARVYGAAASGVDPVTIRLADAATARAIARRPALGLGEAYMDGRLTIERGDIRALLELLAVNLAWEKDGAVHALRWRPRRLAAAFETWNRRRRARRNVARHYDLSADLFRLFLDSDLQYSCAYFADPGASLDEAQAAKKAHIAAKLRLGRRCWTSAAAMAAWP